MSGPEGSGHFSNEVSPDEKRPAYSAYFNALASPAALLAIAGAVITDLTSPTAVFVAAIAAAIIQLLHYKRLERLEVG